MFSFVLLVAVYYIISAVVNQMALFFLKVLFEQKDTVLDICKERLPHCKTKRNCYSNTFQFRKGHQVIFYLRSDQLGNYHCTDASRCSWDNNKHRLTFLVCPKITEFWKEAKMKSDSWMYTALISILVIDNANNINIFLNLLVCFMHLKGKRTQEIAHKLAFKLT